MIHFDGESEFWFGPGVMFIADGWQQNVSTVFVDFFVGWVGEAGVEGEGFSVVHFLQRKLNIGKTTNKI